MRNELDKRKEDAIMEQRKIILANLAEDLQEVLPEIDWTNEDEVELLHDLLAAMEKEMEQERDSDPKKVVVFLPYKASMWDSLESVWRAAASDPSCETHVIPIPYYERREDFSLGTMHYEGDLFPDDVPVEDYRDVSLDTLGAHVIYIHNPYDGENLVTTIAPAYYSDRLKACTDLLIYIPYYATAGGQGDGQAYCPAYANADYIVVQAEYLKGFYDTRVPREKLLALGSPKFDKVVKICRNPPAPPEEWAGKMAGRKVYFYNTSLSGMLMDTISFLRKMEYVFDTFAGRADACLLWRPHPLLEQTFQSMRPRQYAKFERLKERFIAQDLGILDTSPSIEQAVALSDAYIGDSGTSVTALFGVAGKPIFILDNQIHSLPGDLDWQGKATFDFPFQGDAKWLVTWNNKLFHSPQGNFQYEYYCDLSPYAGDFYYRKAFEIGGRIYVCPANARDILVLENRRIADRVVVDANFDLAGAFFDACRAGKYLFLMPLRYPAIVRYDTEQGTLRKWANPFGTMAQNFGAMWLASGSCIWQDKLIVGTMDSGKVALIDIETMETEIRTLHEGGEGCAFIAVDGDTLWISPVRGTAVFSWKPRTDEVRRYEGFPEGFQSVHVPLRGIVDEYPLGRAAVGGRAACFPLFWGNQHLMVDKATGRIRPWSTPFSPGARTRNGYFFCAGGGTFLREKVDGAQIFVDMPMRKLYRVDLEHGLCDAIPWGIRAEDRDKIPRGFGEISEWFRYGCEEDAFNTLADFLDGRITGAPFDRARQLRAFGAIAANIDGTAGGKIHAFACEELQRRGIL